MRILIYTIIGAISLPLFITVFKYTAEFLSSQHPYVTFILMGASFGFLVGVTVVIHK